MKGLREDQVAYHNLRNEYEKVKAEAAEAKSTKSRLAELEALVLTLRKDLTKEKNEKDELITEKNAITKTTTEVRTYSYIRNGKIVDNYNT